MENPEKLKSMTDFAQFHVEQDLTFSNYLDRRCKSETLSNSHKFPHFPSSEFIVRFPHMREVQFPIPFFHLFSQFISPNHPNTIHQMIQQDFFVIFL
jgi:hypothetical protein